MIQICMNNMKHMNWRCDKIDDSDLYEQHETYELKVW